MMISFGDNTNVNEIIDDIIKQLRNNSNVLERVPEKTDSIKSTLVNLNKTLDIFTSMRSMMNGRFIIPMSQYEDKKCSHCGETDLCRMFKILGDHEPVWLCRSCYDQFGENTIVFNVSVDGEKPSELIRSRLIFLGNEYRMLGSPVIDKTITEYSKAVVILNQNNL